MNRKLKIGYIRKSAVNVQRIQVVGNRKFGKQLTSTEIFEIENLSDEYKDIFAPDPKSPERTTAVEHRIETTNDPVYLKSRHIPLVWEDDVDKQIDEIVTNDIIRPSKSHWNSPILLINKPDGSSKFVCDYRSLNSCTKKDTYPHIKDVIDKMYGASYWSTLDAASAYWAVPNEGRRQGKNAFSIKREKYGYNVRA